MDEARSAFEAGAATVAIDEDGEVRPVTDEVEGPAVAVVRPVSDALKSVTRDGLIRGSVDREAVWAVEFVVLSRRVVARLDDRYGSLLELYGAVGSAGFDWQVSPMPSDP